MERLFFYIWIFLIIIFPDNFWQDTVVTIILYFPAKIIWFLKTKIDEYYHYKKLLRESLDKVEKIDVDRYFEMLQEIEEMYRKNFPHSYKIILRDKRGNSINICPICGSYLRIIWGYKGPFLGCTNYPQCRYTRNYKDIFKINV